MLICWGGVGGGTCGQTGNLEAICLPVIYGTLDHLSGFSNAFSIMFSDSFDVPWSVAFQQEILVTFKCPAMINPSPPPPPLIASGSAFVGA